MFRDYEKVENENTSPGAIVEVRGGKLQSHGPMDSADYARQRLQFEIAAMIAGFEYEHDCVVAEIVIERDQWDPDYHNVSFGTFTKRNAPNPPIQLVRLVISQDAVLVSPYGEPIAVEVDKPEDGLTAKEEAEVEERITRLLEDI